jgi:Dolichyl-phosphate-mannose-protein mannosyltransferase
MTSGRATLDWSLGMGQFKPTANLLKILSQLYTHDVHPPLYFWTLALWRVLFGTSLEVARMFSTLFTLATLTLLYRYAVGLGVRWSCVPVVIYAVSAAGLRYAYNARPYAMASFLIVLTLFFAHRKSKWAGLCAAACIATHYFSALCVGPIIAIECLVKWKSDRRWSLLTALSFVIFCVPLAALATKHVGARPEQFPGFGIFHKEVDTLVLGALRGSMPGSSLESEWKYALLGAGCLALFGGVWAIRRKLLTVPLAYGGFLSGFMLIAMVTNKSIGKMPTDYYLGISAPLFALLLWFAVDTIPLVAGPALALILIAGTVTATPIMVPRDYRKILTKISSDCSHCAVLVSSGGGIAVPACSLYESKGLDIYLLNPGDTLEGVVQKIGRHRVIYLIPANESAPIQIEREFIQTFAATPGDDYFRVDPTRLSPDGGEKNLH